MIRSLKRALQPAITDVSVGFLVPKKVEVTQSPQNLPPVFNGEKLVMYATLKMDKAVMGECTAILKGNMLGAELEHKIPFTLNSSSTAQSLPVIHHLAAKALITDWEREGKDKKSIVDLSIESSVISSHTAFIAIDEESSEPVSGSMKTYDLQACVMERSSFYHPFSMSFGYTLSSSAPMGGGGRGRGGIGGMPRAKEKSGAMVGAPRKMKKNSAGLFARSSGLEMSSEADDCLAMVAPPPPMLLAQSAPPAPTGAGLLSTKSTNTLEGLISAQQLNGSWELTTSFAQLVGKPLPELEAACPIGREGAGAKVWATVLAVSLLRSRYSSQQDEWELIAMKAESWLKKQSLPAGVTLEKLFQEAHKQTM